MRNSDEPQFLVRSELRTFSEGRPDLIAFRIYSKAQTRSNPKKPHRPVSEMLEEREHESPLFVLKADIAVNLARDLLNVAHDSQAASDSVD